MSCAKSAMRGDVRAFGPKRPQHVEQAQGACGLDPPRLTLTYAPQARLDLGKGAEAAVPGALDIIAGLHVEERICDLKGLPVFCQRADRGQSVTAPFGQLRKLACSNHWYPPMGKQ